MGLGSFPTISLADARERAQDARRLLADGIDPLAHKRAQATQTERLWGAAVDDYIDTHKAAWRSNSKGKRIVRDGVEMGSQENQWRQSLKDYGPDRALQVRQVDTGIVLACLIPLWKPRSEGGKVETATRLRGRLERILGAEAVRRKELGYANPARWDGHLEHLLPSPEKLKQKRHHPALPYDQAPALYAALVGKESASARALRYLLLTAARTQEVTGFDPAEVDFKHALWRIPGERMKADVDHEVPLVAEALELAQAGGFALSENTMLFYLQRKPPRGLGFGFTVHGLRSTFRDWVSETTTFSREVAEMSLAHQVKDKTEAAYRRGKLRMKRRELMEAWAAYLGAAPPTAP